MVSRCGTLVAAYHKGPGGGGLQMHGVLTAARAAQVTVEDEPVQQQGNEIGMLVSNVGPDMLLALEENVRGN
jgi:hypothetical protein